MSRLGGSDPSRMLSVPVGPAFAAAGAACPAGIGVGTAAGTDVGAVVGAAAAGLAASAGFDSAGLVAGAAGAQAADRPTIANMPTPTRRNSRRERCRVLGLESRPTLDIIPPL